MLCPVCPAGKSETFKTYQKLILHLSDNHSIQIKDTSHQFATKADFDKWYKLDGKGAKFTITRRGKHKDCDVVVYSCNCSNILGFKSKANVITPKAGPTKKMYGTCPSRIYLKVFENSLLVNYCETHVGHGDDLRAYHQTVKEQYKIVTQERKSRDAEIAIAGKIEKVRLYTIQDLTNLNLFVEVDKRKHCDNIVLSNEENVSDVTDESPETLIDNEEDYFQMKKQRILDYLLSLKRDEKSKRILQQVEEIIQSELNTNQDKNRIIKKQKVSHHI